MLTLSNAREMTVANKQSFTPDEWKKLVDAPMMASIAVTAADPSGIWGTLKEGMANARGMAEGRGSSDELIKAIVEDFATSEGRHTARDGLKEQLKGVPLAEITQRAVASLREVAGILDSKAPADASAVKQWLYANANRVAEASKEGSFLGFGGVRVSDKEKVALHEIAAALGIPG